MDLSGAVEGWMGGFHQSWGGGIAHYDNKADIYGAYGLLTMVGAAASI